MCKPILGVRKVAGTARKAKCSSTVDIIKQAELMCILFLTLSTVAGNVRKATGSSIVHIIKQAELTCKFSDTVNYVFSINSLAVFIMSLMAVCYFSIWFHGAQSGGDCF